MLKVMCQVDNIQKVLPTTEAQSNGYLATRTSPATKARRLAEGHPRRQLVVEDILPFFLDVWLRDVAPRYHTTGKQNRRRLCPAGSKGITVSALGRKKGDQKT